MKHIETHIKMMEKNKAKSAFDIFSAQLAEAVSCLESNWWSPQTLIRVYFGDSEDSKIQSCWMLLVFLGN